MPAAASPSDRHHDVTWPDARRRARLAGAAMALMRAPEEVALDSAAGHVLAREAHSLVDMPAFDTAAMDGWAVVGDGPWQIVGEGRAGRPAGVLGPGEAVWISTGAVVPPAAAVLRSEHGRESDGEVTLAPGHRPPRPGTDTRLTGEEVRSGEVILAPGAVLTPPAIGLAAAAGHDALAVVPRPSVTVFVLGDELVERGLPTHGNLRDALSPQLPGWVAALHGTIAASDRVADSLADTVRALEEAATDIVITTGGTARGRADHVREALTRIGGRWLVDGVAVRPGHPMKLGELADGRLWIALPGNPLAAVSALVTLGEPLFAAVSGRHEPSAPEVHRLLAEPLESSPGAHRLIPATIAAGRVNPVLRRGPAMLAGLSGADVLAVVPPGPARLERGSAVRVLPLPWGSGLVV